MVLVSFKNFKAKRVLILMARTFVVQNVYSWLKNDTDFYLHGGSVKKLILGRGGGFLDPGIHMS